MKYFLFVLVVAIVGITVNANSSSRKPNDANPPASTISTTTTSMPPITTTTVRLASNGHPMRLCSPLLKNYTNYSYCYWTGPEKVPGKQSAKNLFNTYGAFEKKPIIGSNFSYANLSYGFVTTDPSGMYAVVENVSVTNRPLHDCILDNTTFAVDVQEMQALNSQPLDAKDFTGSTISGNTLKGIAGRWINFSGANLKHADLVGSLFNDVTGKPASLPPGWVVDRKKDIVQL